MDYVDSVRDGSYAKKNPKLGIPVLYLQGGVGAGKTRAFLAPVIECVDNYPGLRVLIGRQDFADLRISAMETFFEIYPPDLILSQNKEEHRVVNHKGSHIFFRELKDLSGLGSQEFGIVMVCEAHEVSEKTYRTLKQRLRQAGMPLMLLMEGNPPNKDHWLYKLTLGKEIDPDITMLQVSTYENWDNLPSPYKISLENSPESWKKKYLHGLFGFTPDGTPFYDGFNEAFHKRTLKVNPHKSLLLGWDYGFRHPACSISQIDDQGRWGIHRELMGENIVIDQFADQVKIYLNTYFPKYPTLSYGDPAGTQVSDKSEKTSEDILHSKGFAVISKPSTYRERKEIFEKLLCTIIGGRPALMVDPKCLVIIDGFNGGYHYPMLKEGQSFTPIKTETPFKDGYYEHLMNSLEYVGVNLFSPVSGGAEGDDRQPDYHFGQPKKETRERHAR